MYVSPKNILLQVRVNLNHPWTRTVGAGRPQAAVLEAPPTSTRSRTTISVLFVVCSPPVCLNKGKKCLLAERPEACLVRGQGCPQHNPQPARLHRRFARRLLARRGVAREHRDEGGKLGNAVSRVSKQVYGQSATNPRCYRRIPSETLVEIRPLACALRTLPFKQRVKAWCGRDTSRRLDGSPPAL